MDKMERCRYCGNEYKSNSKGEHAFPYGLGGQDIYMSCVCGICNNYFSSLERELFQSSLVGLMRSVEGVQGYKKYEHLAPFKAQILLMAGRNNEIIYEVGQFLQMQVFVRPQVIMVKDTFYLESDSEKGSDQLFAIYKKWKKENLRMVTKMPGKKGEVTEYVVFQQDGSSYTATEESGSIKIKGEILLDLLPASHDLHKVLTPRLFIDDDKTLRVRAASQQEAMAFMCKLLTAILGPLVLNSFGEADIHQPVISIGYSFDAFKSEQALVKIGLNCLMHYFPQIKDEPCLEGAISFVMTGAPLIPRQVEEQKSGIIDSCEDAHNIFFYQAQDSVRIRISLFNGSFIFAFYVTQLNILHSGQYNRLVINHQNRTNKFEDQSAFFRSFDNRRSVAD